MPKRKVSSILVGVAGEYYVAAELSNLGWPVKHSKSRTGVTELVYLGVEWNSANFPAVSLMINQHATSPESSPLWIYKATAYL